MSSMKRMISKPPSRPSRRFSLLPDGPPGKFSRAFLIPAAILVVVLIAWLDYATGPYLSCSILYLIPVAMCAWWGGFPHGILLAIAGSAAWHLVDMLENPAIPQFAALCNGLTRFGTLALVSFLVSRLHAGLLRERRLARSDPLTGAANARTFYEIVTSEAERARRTVRPLTLAYLDVDDFKFLNDQFGHSAGDQALQEIVQIIQRNTRPSDLLARLGGDEFSLLLPEVGPEVAFNLLVRLERLVAEELAGKGWPVSLSIGAITFLLPHEDVDQMIQQVDGMMYGAKRKGKGRVEHTVIQPGAPAEIESRPKVERRATARLLCGRAAYVQRAEGGLRTSVVPGAGEEEVGTVKDISAEGMRLHLGSQLAPDTLVVVEPLAVDTKTLLVRVLYSIAEEGGWSHGCKLATNLSGEELCAWLGSGFQNRVSEKVPEPQPGCLP
jgi:diguanylate cyclase (GGDEF)-like protein